MGGFWKYFRDGLGWPLVRMGGALAAIVKGAASFLDQAMSDLFWLRRQFNPKTCETELVERYARARGLVRHRLETSAQFRVRTVNAYAWQLLGGTEAGLRQILSHYGYVVVNVVNMRDVDPARWAEFRVVMSPPASGFTPADFELVGWAVNDQKPARSKLVGLSYDRSGQGEVFFGAGAVVRLRMEVFLTAPVVRVAGSGMHTATGLQVIERINVMED